MLTKPIPSDLAQELLSNFEFQLERAYRARHKGVPIWLKELDTNDRNAIRQALQNLLSQ